MRNVFTAQNPAAAHAVAGDLKAEGIDCVVEGEMLTGALMALPMDASTLPGVFVRDSDTSRAIALIAERYAARAAAGAAAGDDDLAAEHPGLVWFKRLLLADILFGVPWSFVVAFREIASWTGRAPVRPDLRGQMTAQGIAFVVACVIACLVVPGRRVRR